MSLDLLMFMHCFLSLSVCLTDGCRRRGYCWCWWWSWSRWGSLCLHACACQIDMFRFDEIVLCLCVSLFATSCFFTHSVLSVDTPLLFSFFLLAVSSILLLFLAICNKFVIVIVRERSLCKFDDRLDNSCSVQGYYRLSMWMKEASARCASSRVEKTLARDIHHRDVFFVSFVSLYACVHDVL